MSNHKQPTVPSDNKSPAPGKGGSDGAETPAHNTDNTKTKETEQGSPDRFKSTSNQSK